MVHMYIVKNTTIFLIVRLLLIRYNYMFRPSMLAIFRLYMKHLTINYIYTWLYTYVPLTCYCTMNLLLLFDNTTGMTHLKIISTCFGHFYTHRQENRQRSTAYGCLSCCSCCDAGESGGKMCAVCGECCLPEAGNILHTLHSITTATTGQTTIGSGTQSVLLTMGIKMPETCWDNID